MRKYLEWIAGDLKILIKIVKYLAFIPSLFLGFGFIECVVIFAVTIFISYRLRQCLNYDLYNQDNYEDDCDARMHDERLR